MCSSNITAAAGRSERNRERPASTAVAAAAGNLETRQLRQGLRNIRWSDNQIHHKHFVIFFLWDRAPLLVAFSVGFRRSFSRFPVVMSYKGIDVLRRADGSSHSASAKNSQRVALIMSFFRTFKSNVGRADGSVHSAVATDNNQRVALIMSLMLDIFFVIFNFD